MKVVELRGDYSAREDEAAREGLDNVSHFHANSVSGNTVNHVLVEVAYPISKVELALAKNLVRRICALTGFPPAAADELGIPGVRGLRDGERGEWIIDENDSALIIEPLFVSSKVGAAWILDDANRRVLGLAIAEAHEETPGISSTGFSLGHKWKNSSPSDRGATVYGTNGRIHEADVMEPVMKYAEGVPRGGVFVHGQ